MRRKPSTVPITLVVAFLFGVILFTVNITLSTSSQKVVTEDHKHISSQKVEMETDLPTSSPLHPGSW